MNNYIFSHSEELSIEVLATSILAKKTNIDIYIQIYKCVIA